MSTVYWSLGHQQSMTASRGNRCLNGYEDCSNRKACCPPRPFVCFSGAEANQLTGSYSCLETSGRLWKLKHLEKVTDHSCLGLHSPPPHPPQHPSAGTESTFQSFPPGFQFFLAKASKYILVSVRQKAWDIQLTDYRRLIRWALPIIWLLLIH